MSQTDTEKQYQSFVADTSSVVRRRRVTLEIGAVAAAAAVVIALVLGSDPRPVFEQGGDAAAGARPYASTDRDGLRRCSRGVRRGEGCSGRCGQ